MPRNHQSLSSSSKSLRYSSGSTGPKFTPSGVLHRNRTVVEKRDIHNVIEGQRLVAFLVSRTGSHERQPRRKTSGRKFDRPLSRPQSRRCIAIDRQELPIRLAHLEKALAN